MTTDQSNATMQIMAGLANALGVPAAMVAIARPTIVPISHSTAIERTDEEKAALSDFDKARETLLIIIESGKTALEQALNIAASTQQAKAFEVVSKLINDLANANKGLLELHEAKAALVPDTEIDHTPVDHVTNNTIVVGSAAELLTIVEAHRKADRLAQEANVTMIQIEDGDAATRN